MTDHVHFVFIAYATPLVSELNFNYMRFQVLPCQVHSGSRGDTDPPLSVAPPLGLSNTCTDHTTGAFPPFKTCFYLQALSCPLWNNSSVQLHTRAEGRGSHCHVLSIPCPYNTQGQRTAEASPQRCRCPRAGPGHKVLIHVHARQGPVISIQAPFGSSANSL